MSDLSSLCIQCGLCCNGSLFTFLPLSVEEAERMRGLGARVQQRRDGRMALLLGCSALRGTCCGAYEQRPARCREYVCQLGRAVERKERSLEGALAVVAEAKQKLNELEPLVRADDPANPQNPIQRAHQTEAEGPDDERFRRMRTLTREVEAFLQHYFIEYVAPSPLPPVREREAKGARPAPRGKGAAGSR